MRRRQKIAPGVALVGAALLAVYWLAADAFAASGRGGFHGRTPGSNGTSERKWKLDAWARSTDSGGQSSSGAVAVNSPGSSGASSSSGTSSSSSASSSGTISLDPARGSLRAAALRFTVTASEIDAATAANNLQLLTGTAACDVNVHHLTYATLAPDGSSATATAAVLIPSGTGTNCSGNRPLLLYAHGTQSRATTNSATEVSADGKKTDMAQVIDTTSNGVKTTKNLEAAAILAFFAAQGYIVVMPNYLGYDQSSLSYHPFLLATAQANDMIDALRAAKTYIATIGGAAPSAKLFVSGLSQGGFVSMATQREIQKNYSAEISLTAGGHISGPYNLLGFSDLMMSDANHVGEGATFFIPMLYTAYQRSYGNVFGSASDIFQPKYAAHINTLLPTTKTDAELVSGDLLPNASGALTTKALYSGNYSDYLLKDSFVTTYRADTSTTSPATLFRQRLLINTLVSQSWTPSQPMALCGGGSMVSSAANLTAIGSGAADNIVAFYENTALAYNAFSAGGKTTLYNLEDATTVGTAANAAWVAVRNASNYHAATLPYCSYLLRTYFNKQ